MVVSHSSIGFLAADPQAVRLLRETADLQLATHNVFVGGNSAKFTDWATEAWGVRAVCLPNLYCLAETFSQHDRRWQGSALRLGLFGANRPLKNFLSGAAAAVEMARRLHVAIELLLSSGRNEGGNARALDEMTEHLAEQWRARLIEEGLPALTGFPGGAPDDDELPQLIGAAQRERTTGQPRGAARILFRRVAELLEIEE